MHPTGVPTLNKLIDEVEMDKTVLIFASMACFLPVQHLHFYNILVNHLPFLALPFFETSKFSLATENKKNINRQYLKIALIISVSHKICP